MKKNEYKAEVQQQREQLRLCYLEINKLKAQLRDKQEANTTHVIDLEKVAACI